MDLKGRLCERYLREGSAEVSAWMDDAVKVFSRFSGVNATGIRTGILIIVLTFTRAVIESGLLPG